MEEICSVAGIDLSNPTNRIPTETELPALRSLACRRESIMEEMDEKILTVKKLLQAVRDCHKELMEEKAELQKSFSHLDGMLHPIRRVSDDILQYIFEWVYEVNGYRIWAKPIILVCRRWRLLALQTPTLWTEFSPSFNRNPSNVSLHWKRVVGLVKSAPAHIDLNIGGLTEMQLQKVLINSPLDQVAKIDYLDIKGQDFGDQKTCDLTVEWICGARKQIGTLSFLSDALEIDEDEDEDEDEPPPYPPPVLGVKFIETLKVVTPTHLSLHGYKFEIPILQENIQTLRSLSISVILDPESLRAFLQHCPNLEELGTGCPVATSGNILLAPVILEHLTQFEMLNGSLCGVPLKCPMLQRVEIVGGGTDEIYRILSSNPTVKELFIWTEDKSWPDINALAAAAPGITSLKISSSAHFQLLSRPNNGRLPFPSLQRVQLNSVFRRPPAIDDIAELIKVRYWTANLRNIQPLSTLRIRLREKAAKACDRRVELKYIPWTSDIDDHGQPCRTYTLPGLDKLYHTS